MRKEHNITARLQLLVQQIGPVASKRGYALNYDQQELLTGWIVSATNCVNLLTPLGSPYRFAMSKTATDLTMAEMSGSGDKATVASAARGILTALLADIEAGLIVTIESRISGQVFEDFLSHAEALLPKHVQPAGVLAGVAFEDTIRRIGRNHQCEREKVDETISLLVKAQVLTDAKAKSSRAAAHVRTKATHAEWGEFDASDVKLTIATTRDLIDAHLS